MQTEIIIAGFGGQGVLFAGQLLAYAALDQGLETTWMPSYGPEMRGGTANCTVIIADDEIGSPYVVSPQAAIVLNQPSLDKYEPLVKPGGVLVINRNMVNRSATRTDIRVIELPANDLAEELGEKRMLNMVCLGALLNTLPVLPVKAIEQALKQHLPERHARLLPVNLEALRRGAEFTPLQVAG